MWTMILVIFLCLIIIALAIVIVDLHMKRERERRKAGEVLTMLQMDLAAEQIGREEQEENYEQQFLSLNEQIETMQHSISYKEDTIAELEFEVGLHRARCLPFLQQVGDILDEDAQEKHPL